MTHPESGEGETYRNETSCASEDDQHDSPNRKKRHGENCHLLASVAEVIVARADEIVRSWGQQ